MAGVTIKQEHADEVDSVQQCKPVHLSCQVPAVEVYPINVVQGDSILVKLKYTKGMFYQSDDAIADDNQHAHRSHAHSSVKNIINYKGVGYVYIHCWYL